MYNWNFPQIDGQKNWLTGEEIRTINRMGKCLSDLTAKLCTAPPLRMDDYRIWLDARLDQFIGQGDSIPIGSPTWSTPAIISFGPTVTLNFGGPLNFTFSKPLFLSIPLYLDACLILSGEQPTAPGNAPTITVNGGGTGGWGSGNTYFKITYVDDSGAESQASPEAGPTNVAGSPSITFGLNNTPPAEVVYWRIYATEPPGASNSETLIVANSTGPTIYDIPVATTSYTIPRPIYTTVTPPAAQTQPDSCFLPPCWCGKPTWTALDCEIVMDSCATPPTIWTQRTEPSGTNWQNIIGPTAKGDIISHNGTDATLLGVGTDKYVLSALASETTGLKWIVPHPMTTTGDIIYASNTATPATQARLGIGTSGQVLTVSGGLPSWQTPSFGNASVSCILYTGTSVASPGTALFSYSSANGIHGSLALKNTGGTNDLVVQVGYTDKLGTTATENITLGHGALPNDNILQIDLDSQRSAIGIYPPLTAISASVQDAVSGNHSTYAIAAGLVK